MTAAQDEGGWCRRAEQGAERFMAKWIAAEKARAGLRHEVVSPNVTGRTKDFCIIRAFGLQMPCRLSPVLRLFLKKNQSAPRPSEHPPVMGGKMSKRLGGIKGCKYKTSSWQLNRFSDADNIRSTV